MRDAMMIRIFREMQEARFNQIYYQRQTVRLRWMIRGSGCVAAIAASAALASQVQTGLWGVGSAVWSLITLIAAALAAISPLMGWDGDATKAEQAAFGHGLVCERLKRLLGDMKMTEFETDHAARAGEIDALRGSLSGFDNPPDPKSINSSYEQMMAEYPSEKAWDSL